MNLINLPLEHEKNYVDKCITEFTTLTCDEQNNYEQICRLHNIKINFTTEVVYKKRKIKCITDGKIYKSINSCAKAYDITYNKLRYYLEISHNKGKCNGLVFEYIN